MTTIYAPDSRASGKKSYGKTALEFRDGVAEYEGELPDGVRAYLARHGYGIDAPAPEREVVDLPDSRDYAEPTRLNELRDAAVDPQPEDFLPPVNAGQADPHGPLVVAPGIHAANMPKPIHPGPVGSVTEDDDGKPIVDLADKDTQADKESALAADVLVDQTPVPEATQTAAAKDPINTDQRGSAGSGDYDPSGYSVAEVNDYLANASPAERVRVFTAETDGKARKGILEGPHADAD